MDAVDVVVVDDKQLGSDVGAVAERGDQVGHELGGEVAEDAFVLADLLVEV